MASIHPHTREPHPVTHRLHLSHMVSPASELAVKDALAALPGITHCAVNWQQASVDVTYDLNQLHIQEIEACLKGAGFPVDARLMERIRMGLIHFAEDNEVENMSYTPRRFNEPPHIL